MKERNADNNHKIIYREKKMLDTNKQKKKIEKISLIFTNRLKICLDFDI